MRISRLLFLVLCFFISYSEALKIEIGAVEISVPYFVALAGLAAVVIESGLLARRPNIRIYAPAAIFCALYTILGCLALLHILMNKSPNSPNALFRVIEQIGRLSLSYCIMLFASNIALDGKLSARGIRVMIISAGFVGLYGIYQVVGTFGGFYRPILPHTASYGLAKGMQGATRAISTMQEPSFLAGFLCFSIIMTMVLLASGVKQRREKLILWGSLIVQGLCMLLTASSGGFAGFTVALIAGSLLLKGQMRRRLVLVWLIAALVLTCPLLYLLATSRVGTHLATATIGKATHDSSSERLGMTTGALKLFAEHPVTGVGPGMYDDYVRRYAPQFSVGRILIANDVYAELLAETGLVGFTAFMLMFIGLCRRGLAAWRASSQDNPLAAGLCLTLISLAVQFVAYPTFKMEFIWLLFGLVLASTKSARAVSLGES